MLISCPKCHSVYEIADDLIKKTGKKFRCCKCAHIWHAMREDALGFEEENTELLIEPINVPVPPYRNYPANKENFTIPADTPSGKRTSSSKDILKKEGDPNYKPIFINREKKEELTLHSDSGTAFTISMDNDETKEKQITPYFFDNELTANKSEHLTTTKTRNHCRSYTMLNLLLLIVLTVIFLRRELTVLYPEIEPYYNKIYLSGKNNPEYLRFQNIEVKNITSSENLEITADIYNDSFYITTVPDITLDNKKINTTLKKKILNPYEKTELTISVPKQNITKTSLILGFNKP